MEDPQKELIHILLQRLVSRGLISQSICSDAVDSLHSARLPPFFQTTIPPLKEIDPCEHTANTK